MTTVTPTTSWSAGVTLTEQTLFQVNKGSVYLCFEVAKPSDTEDGLLMHSADGIVVPSGNKVYWKLAEVSTASLWYGKFLA